MMMDEIQLTGMPFFGYHGVLPEEAIIGQRFLVSTWLACDLREAGTTDDVRNTINYAEVYAMVKDIVEGPAKSLIETVAQDIAAALLQKFERLVHVTVEIQKPSAPIPGIFEQVSVKIRRTRQNS